MEVKDSAHRTTPSSAFLHYLPLVVVVIIIVLFFSTFADLYARWIKWDEGLSHGLLIIGVFLIFLYRTLPWTAKAQAPALFIFTCLLVSCGSLAWALFHILNISILEQLMLLPLLALVFAASYGWRVAFQHRLLLLLPIFAIPIWDQLNDMLLNISASVVGEMVRAIKMPAIIDGNSIYIPYGHILIADGCSGLRYFVIALAIGYIIGYLNRYDEKRMLIILAAAAGIGLIANWIRIFILILVGYQSEMQSSLMADHETFGWILFGLLCFPAIYFAPVVRSKTEPEITDSSIKIRWLLPLIALTAGPASLLIINPQPQVTDWQELLPSDFHPSTANRMPISVLTPTYGHRENARTTAETKTVFIQLDQYQRKTKDDKLMPYLGRLYNGDEWTTASGYAPTGIPGKITILRHKSGVRQIAQLQWFDVGGHKTHSLVKAKLLQIPALLQNSNRAKIVTLQSECENMSCDSAVTALRLVANDLLTREY